jgi:hypothetical protein
MMGAKFQCTLEKASNDRSKVSAQFYAIAMHNMRAAIVS